MHSIPRRSSLIPGEQLGKYRLCIDIGGGGMARVFLAIAPDRVGRHRYVAIKCLRPELAGDRAYVDMFLDEIRVASQIVHPNVCNVFDSGEGDDGLPYLVMDHLSGKSLAAVRSQLAACPELVGPELRTGLVARLMADTCEGLHAIHEAADLCGNSLGIVHRDICPNNLFLTFDGCVKVLDLGVALSQHQRHQTATGVVKGKYAYLAPEIIAGSRPDRRTDLWALGVVCWELLTGQRLFHGASDLEVVQAIGSGREIAAPSTVAGTCPLMDEIVMCALSRDPDQRFDSARELGRFFNQLLAETGRAMGLAEVADAMSALFPGGRRATRELYDAAESLELPLLEIGELGGELEGSELECEIDCSPDRGDELERAATLRSPVLKSAAIGVAMAMAGIAGFHWGNSRAPASWVKPVQAAEHAPTLQTWGESPHYRGRCSDSLVGIDDRPYVGWLTSSARHALTK